MLLHEKTYTLAEYWHITQLPENENKRLELIHGVILEKGANLASSSQKNTIIALRVGRFLGQFVDDQGLGYVSGADGGYQLGPDHIRIPDAAFIRKDRAGELGDNVFPVAPDLAVEVISESESAKKVNQKVRAYLEAGSRLVWTIYPEDQTIEVHRLNEKGTLLSDVLGLNDTLDGGEVLPGFGLPLQKIFLE